MGVNVMRPPFNLEPSYRVTMLGREVWTWDFSCRKGSSGLQMGSGRRRALGLESMGNLWEEGSEFLKERMLQFYRLRYLLSYPVRMKFK
jgi:hypothetical protein